MKKNVLLILSLMAQSLIMPGQNIRQEPVQGLQAIGRYHNGRVELRWAPADFATWQRGNQNGYIVERYDENGMVSLSLQPLKPLSLEDWASKTDTSNPWNKAAAQLLYGKAKGLPQKPTMAQVKEISQLQAYQLANALIAADLSSETARGMALAFSDPDVQPGKTYGYRIRLAAAQPGKNDTTRVFVETKKTWESPQVQGLRAESAEHAVVLKWNKQLSAAHFTAFWVEKSTDGGKSFARLHTEPLFVSGFSSDGAENFYVDSLKANYQSAHYRITGITPWGDVGKTSTVVKGMGRDMTPPGGAENVKAVSHAANKVTITWDAVVNPADLAGWYIRRGNDAAGIFTNINNKPLPPATRQFTDTEPFAFQSNFYRVVAVDTAGNEGVSFNAYCYIVDSMPPAKPIGFVGAIDSNGVAFLAWEMGKEPDLRGYRVYVSHGPNREFRQLTTEPLLQNFYTDTLTLRTLSEKIFYRVAAVDYRWNHSEYTPVLELKKPDIVPPVAPVFKQYRVLADSVMLQWANSSSEDVIAQVLWKKEGNGDWKMAAKFKQPFPDYFTDHALTADISTTYALEAIDDDNLSSGKSNSISVVATAQRPVVQQLTVSFDKEQTQAKLHWKYPTQDCRFVVLRGEIGGDLTPLKSVPGAEPAFADALREQREYRYAVKAVFSDGSESDISETVSLRLE
ncbi:MAG: hypothetical protein SFV22_16835 [Saprospiraceae bacterium]|nr:hypothetical protein [Saprospiraceae bacterium]